MISTISSATILLVLCFLLNRNDVLGCTYSEVSYGDGKEFVIARSLEVGGDWLQAVWNIKAYPEGYTFFKQPLPTVKNTFDKLKNIRETNSDVDTLSALNFLGNSSQFSVEIGFVGIEGDLGVFDKHSTVVTQGMNMKGLVITQNTQNQAQYPLENERPEANHDVLQHLALTPFLLAKYATVGEVVDAINSGKVSVIGVEYIPPTFKFHWAIKDITGRSVVLEYINGNPVFHENSVGVLTNDPPFDFHLHNLNRYNHISPLNVNHAEDMGVYETEIGQVPKAPNHGYNLVGLPGDLSPPGRFVRAFYMRDISIYNNGRPANGEEAIILATQLLNSVSVPKGATARLTAQDTLDFTQWTTIMNPFSRQLLYRDYRDSHWRSIDLNAMEDFLQNATHQEGTEVLAKTIKVETQSLGIENVTSKFH